MRGPVIPHRVRRGMLALMVSCWCVIALAAAGSPPAGASAGQLGPAKVTVITIDGRSAGSEFDGIGAISGGGGNSRLLIDYPARQRNQILDYLFGPGGADLQLLKLEIGGDANSTDGSEPSIEHSRGQIDCQSGYEWWLAEQAVMRNPQLKLYGLQWGAPGWVGSIWSPADVGYVLDWLGCARSHGLTISYLGGWNENGFDKQWYENLRQALDAGGFSSVQIVADDAHPAAGPPYNPSSAWRVASAAASDPAFKAALAVIGVHDTCGAVTTGFRCESTPAARTLGLPLWESELGTMDGNKDGDDMVRSIDNGFIQARITGELEWPLIDSMSPGLPFENRGLITADQPASGHYRVNKITWAIAQTTQFTAAGWRYAAGASTELSDSGTAVGYLAPGGRDWTLVTENTGHLVRQAVRPQTIRVQLTGGLNDQVVHVWATDLVSADPATWFTRRADIHPARGVFTYTIPAGYVVSFSSRAGQHLRHAIPPPAPQPLPYHATPDASNEAWGLGAQEGAFIYAPCLDAAGQCIEQMAGQVPIWWRPPPAKIVPHPYAVAGGPRWSAYTVTASVLFTTSTGTAGLIGRFSAQDPHSKQFDGYELRLAATGRWQLTRDNDSAPAQILASGTVSGISTGTWHTIALGLHHDTITARIDERTLARVTDGTYQYGPAGIESNWTPVQFRAFSVR